jgi:hypothetical protein
MQVANGGRAAVMQYDSFNNSWSTLGNGPASVGDARDLQLALGMDDSPFLAYADMTLSGGL